MKILLILPCCLLYVMAYAQTHIIDDGIIDDGEINGATYTIYIPDNWNKGLVMYAHGYEETDKYREEEESEDEEVEEAVEEFYEIFTSRGFAFAASAYKRKGLVLKDGIDDTEALRAYFEMNYGKPELTIITGHSMGGMITIATIEKYPTEYQGALPLCGWLGPVHALLKNTLHLLVTYDYLFGDNSSELITGESLVPLESFERQLSQKKSLIPIFAEHFKLREKDIPDVLYFAQVILKETSELTGGLPVGNIQTIYDGFGYRDDSLNKKINRYSAAPVALEHILQYNTPSGQISDPVLALHTTYDELLPSSNYEYYEQATLINHTGHLYNQQYIVRDGHCNFTHEEVGHSFDQLLEWLRTGKKPDIKRH